MLLSDISIKRPVLASMMSLALVLFGLVALQRLPVRELPDIDPPIVSVTTVFPGANAQVVETEVTEKLEEAINSVEGVKELTSESREQVSNITIEFDLSRPIEEAAQDVRDRVSRVRGTLPDEIDEPIIAKQDADANPVIWIALFSDRFSTLELTTIAENLMKDRLQTVKGVSSIFLGGRKRFAIRLRLDSEKMAARQVTVQDVDQALKNQNVELPSGRIESRDREMTIQTLGEMKTAEEFNRMVVKRNGEAFVRLQDIGLAEVGVEDERGLARFNSKPAVGLGVVKQSKANTIEVARGIKTELSRLLPLLPEGVETYLPYDESVYVERSIHEVWLTLGIAFALVVITIFVFLRNVRSTIIPCLTIPVAIVGTYFVLALLGYSINILTMLALVLAIGIVVDDSIVVLENIYRHIEKGLSPMDAAFKGMHEIGFAIIAVTLTLVAVFIPLAFQTSITGRLFIEFAIALSGSVLISAFVALTLTPMVAARVLKPIGDIKHGRVFNFFERGFDRLNHHYSRLLHWSLNHRPAVVAASLALFVLTGWFYTRLAKEFLPEEDKGRLFSFALTPEGSTSEYTDRMVKKLENIAGSTPEVAGYFSAVALARGGPGKANEGLMFIRLVDGPRRSVQDIVGGPNGIAARFFGEVEGALAFPIIPKAIGRGFGQPFALVVQEQDLVKLNTDAQNIANELRAAGYLMNVRSTYEINKPELRVSIDRNRAATLGVSIEEISRTLQILFGGLDLSKVKLGGKEYDVIAQLNRESRLTPADLDRLYVRNDKGELIQISNVVTYNSGAGPSAINHFNRFRSANIEGTPMGIPLGTAVERVEQLLKEKHPGLRYDWAGEASDLKEAGTGFVFILILAVIIIYMVLAAQFESLVHPLTIMLTLPLAAMGAFGFLWILNGVNTLGTGLFGWAHYAPNAPAIAHWLSAIVPRIPAMNINLFSQIGIVLLIGLATKNSILLVEFANQQMAKGKTAREAMIEAGLIRFRPILMTSFSTILGIMPIAIGFGAGGESRRPMGVAAVGGLLTSTFLTLLIVPVAYTVFNEISNRLRRRRHATSAVAARAATIVILLLTLTGAVCTSAESSSMGVAPFRPPVSIVEGEVSAPIPEPRNDAALPGVTQAKAASAVTGDDPSRQSVQAKTGDPGRGTINPGFAVGYAEASDRAYSLERCISEALLNNFDIQQAQERIKHELGAVLEVRSRSIPRASAAGQYEKLDPGLVQSFGPDGPGNDENWNARVEVVQDMYTGGQNHYALKSARLRKEAAVAELQAVMNDVLLEVRERFYDVLLARSEINVQESNVELLEEELQSVKNKFEVGVVAPFNVLRAEVALANGQTPLIRARNNYRIATEELRRVVGVRIRPGAERQPAVEVVGDMSFEPKSLEIAEALDSARQHRPELKRLHAVVTAQQSALRAARGNYQPSLQAFGGYGWESDRQSQSLSDELSGWRAGARVSWSIFDGFATRGKVVKAASELEQARLELAKAQQDVEVEVRRTYSTVYEATELVTATRAVVGQAIESLRLVNSRFDVGAATQLEVLDSRVALLVARQNDIQALHDYNASRARLHRAMGTIAEMEP